MERYDKSENAQCHVIDTREKQHISTHTINHDGGGLAIVSCFVAIESTMNSFVHIIILESDVKSSV